MPAAHVFFMPVLHCRSQDDPLPQSTEHLGEPEQFTVHPPAGHVTAHVLLPWHVTVPPDPTLRLQVLVPSHVTLPPVPAERLHVLPPAQLEVHPAPQLPEHADIPAQLVVQPVPQLTLQSFFDSQLNVALFGGAVPPSAPPSPVPPRVQVPPDAHEQVEPLQLQAPLHSGELLELDAPEHATTIPAKVAANARLPSVVVRMAREATTCVPRWRSAFLLGSATPALRAGGRTGGRARDHRDSSA